MSGVRTLTDREVAAVAHVARETVRAWARQGRLPAVQVDGVWIFDGDDVDAFLARPRSGSAGAYRPAPRVPAGPLLRQIDLAGGDYALGVMVGSTTKRALERAREEGSLSLWVADRLAVQLLGLNAWELWGDTLGGGSTAAA